MVFENNHYGRHNHTINLSVIAGGTFVFSFTQCQFVFLIMLRSIHQKFFLITLFVRLKLWKLGGRCQVKNLWPSEQVQTQLIVFVTITFVTSSYFIIVSHTSNN